MSGQLFGEFIKEKIDQSAQILLVLSDQFLVNEWTNEAFKNYVRSSVVKVSKTPEDRTRLICIQLHDVSDEEVDEYVRDALQIPQFVSLESDEFCFWNKLGYFLYINRDMEEVVPVEYENNSQIELNTRDAQKIKIQPNDLLEFKNNHLIDAPLVHIPSDQHSYNVTNFNRMNRGRTVNDHQADTHIDLSSVNNTIMSEYTPDLVQQSILAQLALKKKGRGQNDVVVNLDNGRDLTPLSTRNLDAVLVKTRNNKIAFAVPEPDQSSYRIIDKGVKSKRSKNANILSDDSDYSF